MVACWEFAAGVVWREEAVELSKTTRKAWHVIDSCLVDVALIGARMECFGEL